MFGCSQLWVLLCLKDRLCISLQLRGPACLGLQDWRVPATARSALAMYTTHRQCLLPVIPCGSRVALIMLAAADVSLSACHVRARLLFFFVSQQACGVLLLGVQLLATSSSEAYQCMNNLVRRSHTHHSLLLRCFGPAACTAGAACSCLVVSTGAA